jgi:hypothetical protein
LEENYQSINSTTSSQIKLVYTNIERGYHEPRRDENTKTILSSGAIL